MKQKLKGILAMSLAVATVLMVSAGTVVSTSAIERGLGIEYFTIGIKNKNQPDLYFAPSIDKDAPIKRGGTIQKNSTSAMWRLNQLPNGNYNIVNKKSGLSLDIDGGSKQNYAKVIQTLPNNSLSQQFKITNYAGEYTIYNVNSNKYLTGYDNYVVQVDTPINMFVKITKIPRQHYIGLSNLNNDLIAAQIGLTGEEPFVQRYGSKQLDGLVKWNFVSLDNGNYAILNEETKLALTSSRNDDNGDPVHTSKYIGSPQQEWEISEIGYALDNVQGYGFIRTPSGKFLTGDGKNVVIHSSPKQKQLRMQVIK